MNVTVQDQQMAKNLFNDPRPVLQNFAAGLIRECATAESVVASPSQFSCCIDIFAQLAQTGKATEESVPLIFVCLC